jgi:purine nucleoside phosphorylase
MDIIGMTNLQEAKLAREAEICYATIALVTRPEAVPEKTKRDLAPIIGRYMK